MGEKRTGDATKKEDWRSLGDSRLPKPREEDFLLRSLLSQPCAAAPFPVGGKTAFLREWGKAWPRRRKEERKIKSLEEKYSHRDVDGAITGLLPF